jgi:hypothetical protein
MKEFHCNHEVSNQVYVNITNMCQQQWKMKCFITGKTFCCLVPNLHQNGGNSHPSYKFLYIFHSLGNSTFLYLGWNLKVTVKHVKW